MSYARPLETGIYIWSDGENINFNLTKVPEKYINIFLARLYDNKKDEFLDRIEQGRKLIEQFEIEVRDDD